MTNVIEFPGVHLKVLKRNKDMSEVRHQSLYPTIDTLGV